MMVVLTDEGVRRTNLTQNEIFSTGYATRYASPFRHDDRRGRSGQALAARRPEIRRKEFSWILPGQPASRRKLV